MKKTHAMKWINLGNYFGYPDCCVREFIETRDSRVRANYDGTWIKRKFHGTGYVPCEACNKLSKKKLLTTIAKNRKHNKPFPDDTGVLDMIRAGEFND